MQVAAFKRCSSPTSKSKIGEWYDWTILLRVQRIDQVAVGARDMAVNDLGREIYANVIVLGYLTMMLEGTLKKEEILKVMLEKIPKYQDENKKAFEMGYSLAGKKKGCCCG